MQKNNIFKFIITIIIFIIVAPPLFIAIGSFILSFIFVLIILFVLSLILISLPILLIVSPSSFSLGIPTLALLFFGIAALSFLIFLIALIIKCITSLGRLILNIIRRFLGY